jgi:hypothetical protein
MNTRDRVKGADNSIHDGSPILYEKQTFMSGIKKIAPDVDRPRNEIGAILLTFAEPQP